MLTPAERRDLAALRDRLAALERRVVSGAGAGVSNRAGPVQVRTTQLGFPAELTAAWDATAGYAWKRLRLTGVTTDDPTIQPAGTGAVTPDGDETLEAGVRGWMEPSPDAQGYYFITGSGESAATPTDDPVPTVTPLICPVDPPEPAECCLPDDPECCPEIFIAFEFADRGTLYTNHAFMDYYYYDCDQRQQFFNSESDPELFERCVDTPVTITCSPAPLTLEDRFYFQGECRTCDQIHAIDPDYACTPPSVKGPVCVTLSGGTGVFSGLSAAIPNLPVQVDLDIPFDYTDEVRGINIAGYLTYDPAAIPPGWYFYGTAHSTQAGSGLFGCGCRVAVTRGYWAGTGVTQTIIAGPIFGTPPSESLLLETPCGAFTIGLGVCSPPPPPPPPPPPAECCDGPPADGQEAEPLADGPDLQFTSDLTGTITLTHQMQGDVSHWVNGLWDLSCGQFGEWVMQNDILGIFAVGSLAVCARPNEFNPDGAFILNFSAADFPGATEDPTVTLIP
ncbi:hypothetical protein J0H58_28815 [bacterium]|nr:hypothetical protein [bacterium]